MLTPALSSWSFHRRIRRFGKGTWFPDPAGGELSVLDFPQVSASLGITDIEICQAHLASAEPAYLATVRAAIEESGCRAINVPIDVGNLAEHDPTRRREEIEHILVWIDAAQRLGSPAVRVNTGAPRGIDQAQARQIVAEGYRELALACRERGMVVLLENHGGLSGSVDAIIRIWETVGLPSFRLCPDFGNFDPPTREEGLRRMLPHASVVHVKVMDIDENGRHEAFDLGRCLDLVVDSGYSGPLSIEFEGRGDEHQGIIRARDFVRSYLEHRRG
ncbi:MAG: sugar phosphate isomerase/epimerase [Chloroflexota bacterium]